MQCLVNFEPVEAVVVQVISDVADAYKCSKANVSSMLFLGSYVWVFFKFYFYTLRQGYTGSPVEEFTTSQTNNKYIQINDKYLFFMCIYFFLFSFLIWYLFLFSWFFLLR